jgi:hypothetical protein
LKCLLCLPSSWLLHAWLLLLLLLDAVAAADALQDTCCLLRHILAMAAWCYAEPTRCTGRCVSTVQAAGTAAKQHACCTVQVCRSKVVVQCEALPDAQC